MYKNKDNNLTYSPSDLTLYLESPFASWMDRYAVEVPEHGVTEDEQDEMQGLLAEKGHQHEHAFLQQQKDSGKTVVEVPDKGDKVKATLEAMQSGADVIFQAYLKNEPFAGYTDFLFRVAGASQLGDFHYEVWDTKLANSVKPKFVIQLCAYAEMLEVIQGVRPANIVVALGNGNNERLRTDDYYFYYQSVKQSFLEFQHSFNQETRPDPSHSSQWGKWGDYAEQILKDADHLSQVANITHNQIVKLNQAGIETMAQLATSKAKSIPRLDDVIFHRLRHQARVQKASEGHDVPEFEVLPHPAGELRGLAMLPPHSPLDVFFDIEGYPLMEGGLEYLWGNTYFDENCKRQFKDFWAHDQEQEKQAFQEFVEWVFARWRQDPQMHIYHYASYEITACRKLMSRYGVCEHEVDELLRNEVFVDLYKVVKGGLIVGEPRYSIKNVEHLYRPKRETNVGSGGDSVVVYEHWREKPDGDSWENSAILNDIRLYNIDDCDSTQELTEWLRELQTRHQIPYLGKTEKQETEIKEEITERLALRDKLLEQAEKEREQGAIEQAMVTENLAWMLEFHRREAKPVFWKLFDRMGQEHHELKEDIECLGECIRTDREAFRPTERARNLAYEYSFDPDQEYKSAGSSKSMYIVGGDDWHKVTILDEHSDFDAGILVVQSKEEPPAILSLIPDDYVNPAQIPSAIQSQVVRYKNDQLKDTAIGDFLFRKHPRIKCHKNGPIVTEHEPEKRLPQIIQAAMNLDNSYLPIQGPPGTGKTFTASHIIGELLKQKKRIGITSNSHKAINNLLIGVAKHTQKENIDCFLACTKETDDVLIDLGVEILKNNQIADEVKEACVIGTTVWGFSLAEMEDSLDYLFVDEAGQVATANLVAMSRATKNIILMGDQMQLGQPTQASHPAESGLSILDYLLHETPTIPDDMGVFLNTTFRMHPDVTDYISQAIYEGKLESAEQTATQKISVPKNDQGVINKSSGLIYMPVEHEGNSQASDEEVEAITQLVNELKGRTFTDKEGKQKNLRLEDILFVAPYNFQVNKLKQALGETAKVGSVDKFQGQEAPVVILSMCSSDASESPRGIDFLFEINRINVAISRAQCLAIIVASPKLEHALANNMKQMNQLNVYSAALAHARGQEA